MARIRTVKPAFFRHEGLFEAEQESGLPLRLSFAGLWTATDREGRFKWQPRTLKLDCLPYDDVDFSRVLDALAARGFIVKYEIDGSVYGFIPSWASHQIINNREIASELPAPTDEAISKARDDDASGTRGSRDTEITQGKGREGNGKGKERDSGTRETRPALDEKFEEFKKAYPKRKGGNPWKPAKAQWDAAIKSGAVADQILLALKAGCGFDREKIGTEYIPQAVKWLKDRRFDDWVSAAEPVVPIGFYASDMSEELAAWDAHNRATTGAYLPRDRNGGWYVPTQWPPGYVAPEGSHGH